MRYVLAFFLTVICAYSSDNCDCVYDLSRLIDSAECVNRYSNFEDVYKQVQHLQPIVEGNNITIIIQGGAITFGFDENGWIKTLLRTLSMNKKSYPVFKAECEEIAKNYETYLKGDKSTKFFKDECVVVVVTNIAKDKRVSTMYFFPKR